jgi:ribosome biogenesis GTPase
MNLLEQYGWNDYFSEYDIQYRPGADLQPGRVISVKGFKYALITETGELDAELAGRLLYGAENELFPKVGDWVYYLAYDSQGYIADVFPRRNALGRKNPGNPSERQVLAANIDHALIVQGLDRDFNLMRLDRYLVQVIASGITPVVVLNKIDLVEDPDTYCREVARLGRDCAVVCCSTLAETGLEVLYNSILKPAKTFILIGSSGVGKSSLVNALLQGSGQKTDSVSSSTGKGKHVTTARELFQLPNGSLLIDTPGMREFGMALADDLQQEGLFPAIDNLSALCRYADCRHLNEQGCAVIEAYENESLDSKVYESYLKLVKEQQHFLIRIEDKKRLGKQFGKMSREAKAYRKKYKY